MREYVYNQYYDMYIERLLQERIESYGLQGVYNKTIVSIKGNKVDIQEHINKCLETNYDGGPESRARDPL